MHQQTGAVFRMDGRTIFFGALIVFSSIIFIVTTLPYLTFTPQRSADARPLNAQEERGRRLYASNGCNYCHSQYLRPQDWTGVTSFRNVGRVAQAGDYFYQQSPMLGSERTGPDLSQEGGAHPDDWHIAHFYNPRYTSPKSIMPSFKHYFNETGPGAAEPKEEIYDLIAYLQSLGGQAGVERAQMQRARKERLIEERGKGNEAVIHEWFPTTWRTVRNPMAATQRSLVHGKQVFTTNCVGCHGLQGNGKGPAAYFINRPAPRNLTDASQQLYFSDGEMYMAILHGVDGTAMPAFGDLLTVNDIWDLTNFIRTIPNGGLVREDLDASMMISPPDVKPIDSTPLPTAEGEVSPFATPSGAPNSNNPTPPGSEPVRGATSVPGGGSEPQPGVASPAPGGDPQREPTSQP